MYVKLSITMLLIHTLMLSIGLTLSLSLSVYVWGPELGTPTTSS